MRLTTKGQLEILNTGNSVFIGEGAGENDDLNCNLNVFIGHYSGYSNITGMENTANGCYSLFNNTTGSNNTANGCYSLFSNTTGSSNTENGGNSMFYNSEGNCNTAAGCESLYYNTVGSGNTAIGSESLFSSETENYNTAVGYKALYEHETGNYNTAIGVSAGPYYAPGMDFSNITCVGHYAKAYSSNHVKIGNSSVTCIGGQVSWSNYSDARIKTNIQEDVAGLDFVMKLRPVTYHFNKDAQDKINGIVDSAKYESKYDIEKTKFTGFIAQEVEEASNSVGYDFSGVHKPVNEKDLYSIAYAEFVVPLVKATQEQQEIIETQENKIEQLEQENIEIKQQLNSLQEQIENLQQVINNSLKQIETLEK